MSLPPERAHGEQDPQLANLRERFAAGATSAVGLFLAMIILPLITEFTVVLLDEEGNIDLRNRLWEALLTICAASYILDGASHHATVGMRIRKIWIGDCRGQRLGYWQCLLRIVLGVLLLPLAPISWFIAMNDPLRRTLADRLTQAIIWTVDEY